MTGHTATPWEETVGIDGKQWAVCSENAGDIIAECESLEFEGAILNAEENAKFIVTACNAHDDLEAALRLSRQYIEWAINDAIDEGFETNAFIAKQDLKIIDAALASVEL